MSQEIIKISKHSFSCEVKFIFQCFYIGGKLESGVKKRPGGGGGGGLNRGNTFYGIRKESYCLITLIKISFHRSGMEYVGPQVQRKDSEFDGVLICLVCTLALCFYDIWKGLLHDTILKRIICFGRTSVQKRVLHAVEPQRGRH